MLAKPESAYFLLVLSPKPLTLRGANQKYILKGKYRFCTIFFLLNKPFCSNELRLTRCTIVQLRVPANAFRQAFAAHFVRSEAFFPIP